MQTDRFQPTKSGKFNWNEGLKTVGDTLTGIFRKPDNIVNNTYIQEKEEEENNNTMLYVGIGGAVILLVVLIIVLKR